MSGYELKRNGALAEDVKRDGHENKDDDLKDIHNGIVHRRQRLLSLSVPRKFFCSLIQYRECRDFHLQVLTHKYNILWILKKWVF